MRKQVYMRGFLAAVLVSGCLGFAALAETSIKPLSIKEIRYKDLSPQKKPEGNSFFFDSSKTPGLTLTVELSGDTVARATKYGFVTINSAKDDTGKELKKAPKGRSFRDNTTSFVEINRKMMYWRMNEREAPKDRIKVDLRLDLPSRSAKNITLVDGFLKLQTGQPVKVVTDDVRTKVGKTLQDPRLEKCGVQVKIISSKGGSGMFDFGPDDPSKAVGVQVSGKLDAIQELRLVDSSGDRLNTGSMSMGSDTSKTYFLESEDSLPQNTKLVITVVEGQEEVKIPFKFQDIPLP